MTSVMAVAEKKCTKRLCVIGKGIVTFLAAMDRYRHGVEKNGLGWGIGWWTGKEVGVWVGGRVGHLDHDAHEFAGLPCGGC